MKIETYRPNLPRGRFRGKVKQVQHLIYTFCLQYLLSMTIENFTANQVIGL